MATAQIPIADELDLNQLLQNLIAIKKGNFSARMPVNKTGIAGKIADTINDIIDLNEGMITEFERISNVVGKEGKINQRAVLVGAKGAWIDGINSINTLITDLVQPTTETARVIRAVANGVLSQTSPLEIDGRHSTGRIFTNRPNCQCDGHSVKFFLFRSNSGGKGSWHRWEIGRTS